MRGESKYHYVDLSLIDEHHDSTLDTEHMQLNRDTSVSLERPNLKRYDCITRYSGFLDVAKADYLI